MRRTTKVDWQEIAKVGYPTIEEFGPYPCVIVALACDGKPDWGHDVRLAELRFFGRDQTRPYWVSPRKSDGYVPIENDSWHVTHWAPWVEHPARLDSTGAKNG